MFITHFEPVKAVKILVIIQLQRFLVSSAGRICSSRVKVPSRLQMEMNYWSQNRASPKDTHNNRSFCLIVISFLFNFDLLWNPTIKSFFFIDFIQTHSVLNILGVNNNSSQVDWLPVSSFLIFVFRDQKTVIPMFFLKLCFVLQIWP